MPESEADSESSLTLAGFAVRRCGARFFDLVCRIATTGGGAISLGVKVIDNVGTMMDHRPNWTVALPQFAVWKVSIAGLKQAASAFDWTALDGTYLPCHAGGLHAFNKGDQSAYNNFLFRAHLLAFYTITYKVALYTHSSSAYCLTPRTPREVPLRPYRA